MQDWIPLLERWYAEHGRHELPWRRAGTGAYEVWVSEVMLQQTQVSRVIPYYLRFLDRFPTVESLAETDWETFLPYYQGLGYYRRGRNMLKTAQAVVEQYDGTFPQDPALLEKLPGIGKYTARAIASFAYNQPVLAFDTNHQRVFGRVLHGTKTAVVDVAALETQLQGTDFRTLNAALMDFANDICTRTPQCQRCPLQAHCQYFQTQGTLEVKVISKKSTFPNKSAQVFLYLHENHQKYYSSVSETFEPFVLPAETNTREAIKQYFRDVYKLELAVRPPHKREYVDGQPTLFVNAQILLGEPNFEIFSKAAVRQK